MIHNTRKLKYLILLLLAALLGCNMPGGTAANPTPDVTQAYQTVAVRLTEAAAQTPVATPPATPTAPQPTTPAPSNTPVSNATPLGFPSPTATTKACDQAGPGSPKIDVTIDDDTEMQPGQSFTKTWRLQNTGSCAWTKDYSIAVFSGESMSAPSSVPLPERVEPGESIDISVELVAPATAGTYQGDWKLRNADYAWFGIGPGGASTFWVRILVAGDGTITPTAANTPTGTITPATPTLTSTPGPTAYPGPTTQPVTPAIHTSGSNALEPDDRIDLDSNTVNNEGEDINYTLNNNGRLVLMPVSGALIGVFGGSTPSYNDCLATSINDGSIAARNIPAGTFLCYRTDKGRYGWLRLLSWSETDPTLSLQLQTWTIP